MFANCTSLTAAPSSLPATILGQGCYTEMFKGCTSLTAAPLLIDAYSRSGSGYNYMFMNCTNLSYIEVDFTNWSNSGFRTGWVINVSPTGIFKKPYSLSDRFGTSYIP